jgi:phospholipid/cholesterol/gamma-HCH transport system ATP-binding protein
MALIELRHIFKRFGWVQVLNGVDLEIERGKCLVVVGASGSGKSVLLKHMVGLLKPDAGEVWFAGRRIDNLRERELMRVRQRFGFLFQMGALFDSYNVIENVGFPLTEHTNKSPAEVEEIALRKLTMVGLPDVAEKMPAELSGGQRKRVALARAIALDPEVILYDEPTTGLDPVRSDVINELILKLQHELSVTSVVVTHDMNSAFKVADRMVMLYDGKFIFDGTAEQMRTSTNDVVKHFVEGEASEKELEALRTSME